MKPTLIALAVIVAAVLIIFNLFRDPISFALMRFSLEPDTSFAASTPPEAPDYANELHWAALPWRKDNADLTPEGVADAQASAQVDVFFIHPTTYYTSAGWNQPLDHPQANEFTDEQVLPNQAGVFNSCCRVFAPRYRQATLYSFFDEGADGAAAIDFAYEDIKAAFEHYLRAYSDGRPFIIAGHSQGALHADRLLRDYVAGTDLASRLVAAYPVGFNVSTANGIAVCNDPLQTGCQVGWNTMQQGVARRGAKADDICVNPLTWSAGEAHAPHDANLGAVSFASGAKVEAGAADARCNLGTLEVSEVRSENYPTESFGNGNYHIYDFSLFHMNIRTNARQRADRFLAEQVAHEG